MKVRGSVDFFLNIAKRLENDGYQTLLVINKGEPVEFFLKKTEQTKKVNIIDCNKILGLTNDCP